MIKANALFFTLLVSLIIGVLTSTLFISALFYQRQFIQNQVYERLVLNKTSATNYMLVSDEQKIPYDQVSVFNLYENSSDSVYIVRKAWGVYDLGIIKAFSGSDTTKQIIMTGDMADSLRKSALYIVDEGRPILFAGKTLIKGDVYLPEAGVKRTYIDGNYFTEKNLVSGKINNSDKKLPDVRKGVIERLQKMCNKETWKDKDKYEMGGDLPYIATNRSFYDKTLVYYSRDPLTIRRKDLSGNILIVSDTVIDIGEDTRLTDVILFAKRIYISSKTQGNFQAFAKDTLMVEKNTQFKYPTVLGVLETDGKENKALLKIGSGVNLSGSVFQYVSGLTKPQGCVSIDENTMIMGNVYSDAYAEVKGILYGNLTCYKTLVRTPSAVYENHMLNTEIDRSKLSKYFVGTKLHNSDNSAAIVKYLY